MVGITGHLLPEETRIEGKPKIETVLKNRALLIVMFVYLMENQNEVSVVNKHVNFFVKNTFFISYVIQLKTTVYIVRCLFRDKDKTI